MARKTLIIYLVSACVVLFVAIAVAIPFLTRTTTLTFKVMESVGESWVWDFEAKIQNKTVTGYFQSDRGPKTYQFTNLKSGNSTLTVTAPSYRSVEIPVQLKKGNNTIPVPIVMDAYEIEGLAKFFAFEQKVEDGWDISLRAATSEHAAILYHPPLDIRLYVQVYSWNRNDQSDWDKLLAEQSLYYGQIPWSWDTTLESQFRYVAHLDYSLLARQTVSACTIKYLILIRDPDKTTPELFEDTAKKLDSMRNIDQALAYLDQQAPTIPYYTDISWDVAK